MDDTQPAFVKLPLRRFEAQEILMESDEYAPPARRQEVLDRLRELLWEAVINTTH